MDTSDDTLSMQFVLPPPPPVEEDDLTISCIQKQNSLSTFEPLAQSTTCPSPPAPPQRVNSSVATNTEPMLGSTSPLFPRQQSVPSGKNPNTPSIYSSVAKRVSFDPQPLSTSSRHDPTTNSTNSNNKHLLLHSLSLNSSSTSSSPDPSLQLPPQQPLIMSPMKKVSFLSNSSPRGIVPPIQQANLCEQCGRMHSALDTHLYHYREPVVADLLCQLCNQPLVEPLDTGCGHTFCRCCLMAHVRRTMRFCPVDNQPLRETEFHAASTIVQRLLDKLLVVCPNGSYCEQVLTRSELSTHLQHVCPGTMVSCPHAGCHFLGPRATLHSHLWEGECPFHQQPHLQPQLQQPSSSPTHGGSGSGSTSTSSPLSLSTTSSISGSVGSGGNPTHTHYHKVQATSHPTTPKKLTESGNTPGPQLQEHLLRSSTRIRGSSIQDNVTSSPSRWPAGEPNNCCKRLNNHDNSNNNLPTANGHKDSHYQSRAGLRRSASQDSRQRVPAPTIFKFTIDRGVNKSDLGISVVGGRDTPLGCFVIQEIYSEGVASADGRLMPGDQLLEVNGHDLTDASHDQGRFAFFSGGRGCEITVYREIPGHSTKGDMEPTENTLTVTLQKKPNSKLGIKLVGKKNQPGLYILDLVKGGEAEMDGRLQRDDRVLSINNVDLRHSNQDVAASIIATAAGSVTLVVSRKTRAQTPDLIRTSSEIEDESSIMDSSRYSGSLTTSASLMEEHDDDDTLLLRDRKRLHQVNSSSSSGGGGGFSASCLGPLMTSCSSASSSSARPGKSAWSKKVPTVATISSEATVIEEGSAWQKVTFSLKKSANDTLGISVAGGLHSQRGDTPIYVTGLAPDGALAKSRQVDCGDLLLSVNNVNLLHLSHESAVEQIKRVSYNSKQVNVVILRCPAWLRSTALQGGGRTAATSTTVSTATGRQGKGATPPDGNNTEIDNFLPTWVYWLTLPSSCGMPRTVVLNKPAAITSLGFSIVGGVAVQDVGSTTGGKPGASNVVYGMARPHDQYQPIAIKSIVPGSVAERSGRLMCGDLLLAVNEYPLSNISHKNAVALLKYVQGTVRLRVLSWPGTIV